MALPKIVETSEEWEKLLDLGAQYDSYLEVLGYIYKSKILQEKEFMKYEECESTLCRLKKKLEEREIFNYSDLQEIERIRNYVISKKTFLPEYQTLHQHADVLLIEYCTRLGIDLKHTDISPEHNIKRILLDKYERELEKIGSRLVKNEITFDELMEKARSITAKFIQIPFFAQKK